MFLFAWEFGLEVMKLNRLGVLLGPCPVDTEVSGWLVVFENVQMRSVDVLVSRELWFTNYGLATLSNES